MSIINRIKAKIKFDSKPWRYIAFHNMLRIVFDNIPPHIRQLAITVPTAIGLIVYDSTKWFLIEPIYSCPIFTYTISYVPSKPNDLDLVADKLPDDSMTELKDDLENIIKPETFRYCYEKGIL